MNKKIFVETDEGFRIIPVDNLYFKTDNRRGVISVSQNLNHAYSVDIVKVPIGIYTDEGKRKVMKRLFSVFMNAIDQCREILTIESSLNGVLYFKDGKEILKKFDAENQTFTKSENTIGLAMPQTSDFYNGLCRHLTENLLVDRNLYDRKYK